MKKIAITSTIIALLFSTIYAVNNYTRKNTLKAFDQNFNENSKPQKLEAKKVTIYKASISEKKIAEFTTQIADEKNELRIGLMNVKDMGDSEAMLFIFPKQKILSFWMKNTYIPLDIIFADSNGIILNIAKNAKPHDLTSLKSASPAKYALEVNAGLSEKYNIKAGDLIKIDQ